MSRARTAIGALIVVGVVVGVVWYVRRAPAREETSVKKASADQVVAPTNGSDRDSPTGSDPGMSVSDSIGALQSHAGSADYPVKLEALRARFPDNRYWALGAPTSDPAVAKARAARAEADNKALGRIQANEATPTEIRAYYAERRALSRDYVQISQAVLDDQGSALPERDRGMFELSVKMHNDRLQQIDRDESDALTRRSAAHPDEK